MFILDSGKFASDPEGMAAEVLGILDKAGATVVEHRPWLDAKLAYPIEGRRKGLHYLVYFKMPGAGADELTRRCKLSDVVLRHLVIKQPQVLFDQMVEVLAPTAEPEAGDASEGEKAADAGDASDDETKKLAEAGT
ncbi:MAG: 30S ribosomal protein S6 [Planctomycetaceae bacterium]|nr:30S ribosomal protein S6 [Planctomycetaceae bacterium]